MKESTKKAKEFFKRNSAVFIIPIIVIDLIIIIAKLMELW